MTGPAPCADCGTVHRAGPRFVPRPDPMPDAFHFTPDVADEELAAWQQILHPAKGTTTCSE